MKAFRELSLGNKISTVLLYILMNLRVVFGPKAFWFLAGTAVYFGVFYLVARFGSQGPTVFEALAWLVWLPTTLFAVFFSMEIISKERDTGMLETFFTVSVSVYRLWLLKFMTLGLAASLLALGLIAATDAYFVDIPVLLTLVYVFPPLCFFAGLTVLFSAMFKGGNAAGICVIAILAFVMLLSGGLATTVVFPYLNPLDPPKGIEPFVWIRTVLYNKVAYTLLGCLWFWRALRWLDRRERLLK